MRLVETPLAGVWLIAIDKREDTRGFFARTWCRQEFAEFGLETGLAQCSISFNDKCGTLRGLHYQTSPQEETKLIRCTAGSIFDVAVDLRPASATYLQHFGAVISAANHQMMYIPAGFAHGFLTLTDNTEVFYQISAPYSPVHSHGVRWNDPAFGIGWPGEVRVICDRDRMYPDYVPVSGESRSTC